MRGQVRMCEQDRERYGAPEWLLVDSEALYDMPFSQLDQLERDMGFSGVQLLEVEIPAYSARAYRALLYVALQQAGVTVAWKDFQPTILRITWRKEGDDETGGNGDSASDVQSGTDFAPPDQAAQETQGQESTGSTAAPSLDPSPTSIP